MVFQASHLPLPATPDYGRFRDPQFFFMGPNRGCLAILDNERPLENKRNVNISFLSSVPDGPLFF